MKRKEIEKNLDQMEERMKVEFETTVKNTARAILKDLASSGLDFYSDVRKESDFIVTKRGLFASVIERGKHIWRKKS